MPIGINFTEVSGGPSATTTPPTAVIALIGGAPVGPIDTLTRCKSAADDVQFGKEIAGFDIPQALKAIRANDPSATVLVVNVAQDDAGTAETNVTVTNEVKVLTGTTPVNLAFAPIGSSPGYGLTVTNTAGNVTYTVTTDYTIDAEGVLTRVSGGAITSGQTVHVDYTHLPSFTFVADKAQLTHAPYRSAAVEIVNSTNTVTYIEGDDYTIDAFGLVKRVAGGSMTAGQSFMAIYQVFDGLVLGDIEGTADPRTGLYQYELAYDAFGYMPTIWISPNNMQTSGVLQALQTWATTYGGVILVDGIQGDSVSDVVTSRGGGSGDVFDVADERVICCYPYAKVTDSRTGLDDYRVLSPYIAGYMSFVDRAEGPHVAIGNYHLNGVPQPIKGIRGLELQLSYHPSVNITSDVNTLADAQVLTVRTGNVPWGDRSSAYRDSTAVTTFYSVRRVADIIKVAITDGAQQFIGRPINRALIDAILQNGNGYLSSLVQRGWVVSAVMSYNPADNSDEALALGQLTFGIEVIPSVPTSQLNYQMAITVEGLARLINPAQ